MAATAGLTGNVTTWRAPTMDLKDLKKIVELVSEHNLNELSIEQKGIKLSIKRGGTAPVVMHSAAPVAMHAPAPVSSAAPAAAAKDEDAGLETIVSPMVGTFYRSPSPEADMFVKVGDRVGPDTVVCIIEAMKVMNEIKAEKAGVIRKICVENADSVEYGQVLFKIESA
jgi:acetyl-CoA carboxylase biotin carboxyl carrier protein